MEEFIKYFMILILVLGCLSTGLWQYLLYQKLKSTGQKTTLKNIKKLPENDITRNKILLFKKIGNFGIGAYLIWFLITLIINLNSN